MIKQELVNMKKQILSNQIDNKCTLKLNVLKLSRTDIYAHVLCIFVKLNIHTVLEITTSQLLDFILDVASEYTLENSYHTFYHAADVTNVLYYLCRDLSADNYLTEKEIAFLMIAALCHDMGHLGQTNSYQAAMKTNLFKQFGKESTLEKYSVFLTNQLLDKHGLAPCVNKDVIQDLILSTDMAFHSTIHQQTTDKAKKDSSTLCKILLHAADISNMTRPWLISKQWSDLIIKEFFQQGDQEKENNMSVSPGMDRDTCLQTAISLKFSEMILPFFESLVNILPKAQVLVDFLVLNRTEWESLEQPKNGKKRSRRLYSIDDKDDIVTTPPLVKYSTKRIKLEFKRSFSFPTTVLYQNRPQQQIIELNLHHHKLVRFKPSSSIYDYCNNNINQDNYRRNSIVLYHPFDQ